MRVKGINDQALDNIIHAESKHWNNQLTIIDSYWSNSPEIQLEGFPQSLFFRTLYATEVPRNKSGTFNMQSINFALSYFYQTVALEEEKKISNTWKHMFK